MTPNPDAPVQPQSWFSRNWKWLVPVGCLVPFLCCASFVGVTYFGVTALIKNSTPFKDAITLAEKNADVRAALGTPLSAGLSATGSINETNGRGTADFTVGIEGPKGKGSMHVTGASGASGRWELFIVDVDTDDGRTIHVVDAPAPPDDDD